MAEIVYNFCSRPRRGQNRIVTALNDSEAAMQLNHIYTPPDFNAPRLQQSPAATLVPAPADGIAPSNYHATSNHPEYVKIASGAWLLAPESRMDAVFVVKDERIEVVEARRLRKGDLVVTGRTENGEEGILVHEKGFSQTAANTDKFAFRSRGTRETPFSYSYDALYEILKHDRQHGHIVWVLGPAVAFDKDSRNAMQGLIENGFLPRPHGRQRPGHPRHRGSHLQHRPRPEHLHPAAAADGPLQPPRHPQRGAPGRLDQGGHRQDGYK
jgi:hypothetical protein